MGKIINEKVSQSQSSKNDFYLRILTLAKSKGKSLNQIERELKYPRNALSNYKNSAIPSGMRLIEISEYFEVSPRYLVGKEKTKECSAIQVLFNQLTIEEKRQMYLLSSKWIVEHLES